jgi:hypothetical protein
MKRFPVFFFLIIFVVLGSVAVRRSALADPPESTLLSTVETWLAEKEGSVADKEAILSIIRHALEDDLPVEMLVDKIKEGLGPAEIAQAKVPLPQIVQEVSRRVCLLSEVRDLLWNKGIFSLPEGEKAVVPALSPKRFDSLVTEIADALGDYLEGGGSPLEGYLLFQTVSHRLWTLSQLTEPVISKEDADLILNSDRAIKPGELTRVVSKALEVSQE